MKKTSRRGKALPCVLCAAVICWLAIFITDFTRSGALKDPVFAFAGETADDGGSGTYRGLGYSVEVTKTVDVNYGVKIIKVEMYLFGRLIAASVE